MSLKQGKYYSLTCPSAIWKIHEMAGADGAILDHRVEAGEKECSWGYLNFLRLAHSSMRKKWSWHHFWAMVTFLCLSFLKADPETRIWMQVVYLGGDVRHHSKGVGEWEWEGRKANKGLDHEQVTAEGNWGSISLCDLLKTMWNRSKGIKALFHELRCTGWGSFLGLIPPEFCLPLVQAEHALLPGNALVLFRAVFRWLWGPAKEIVPDNDNVYSLYIASEPL